MSTIIITQLGLQFGWVMAQVYMEFK